MNRNIPTAFRSALRAVCLFLVGLTSAAAFAAVPPAPSQPVATCAATVNGRCYVNGSFTLTSYSPGASHYHVCRSGDTTGWGGCQQTIATYVGPSYTVSGADVPTDGFGRAYYFRACDAANNCTLWRDNQEAYVYMDATGPTAPGPTTTACKYQAGTDCWVRGSFTISATPATDDGSGVNPNNYWICRSVDSAGGHAGCNVTMTQYGSTSYTVSGSHLPSDGSRRAYRFRARDWVGNLSPWNNPLYVRVDRYNPTVSANNASSEWFTSRTVTITAADATVSAAASSGLAQVRYRWNAAHNGSCTTGTLTSAGGTIQVPEGDNRLYLCAKDNTGRTAFWEGGPYRVHSVPCPNQHLVEPRHCDVPTKTVALRSEAAPASDAEIHRQLGEVLAHYTLEPVDPARMRQTLDATGKLTLRLNGTPHELVLTAVDLRAPSYRDIQVSAFGEIETPREPVSTFEGSVAGVPESDVRLLVHPERLMGYVELEGRRFFIEPAYQLVPGGGSERVVVYEDGDLRPEPGLTCAATELQKHSSALSDRLFEAPALGAGFAPSVTGLREVELATEADYEYYALHGSGTNLHIQGVLNMVNGFYDDAGLVFVITYQRVFTSRSTDPYETCHVYGQWCELWREWQRNQQGVHRDVVHLFSGKALYRTNSQGQEIRTRGTSGLGGTVCKLDVAYVLSTPYREVGLVAHEIGHALGANHIDRPQSPPGPDLERCPDLDCGADSCQDTNSVGGPVMCGAIQNPVTGQHQISIDEITSYVNSSGACLATQ